MGLLLAFAPFVVFAILSHVTAPTLALVAAGLTSLLLVGREIVAGRSAKTLEVGTSALFFGLGALSFLGIIGWTVIGVKLAVDSGLFLIVLFSIARGTPFTIEYARESAPESVWANPRFLQTNRVISVVWLLALGAVAIADLILLCAPAVPHNISVLLTVFALYAAFRFTKTYPERN